MSPGQDYDSLHTYIKGLGSWWHGVESTWIVVSDLTEKEIRDGISGYVDSTDKVLVLALSNDWASRGLSKNANDWLRENV